MCVEDFCMISACLLFYCFYVVYFKPYTSNSALCLWPFCCSSLLGFIVNFRRCNRCCCCHFYCVIVFTFFQIHFTSSFIIFAFFIRFVVLRFYILAERFEFISLVYGAIIFIANFKIKVTVKQFSTKAENIG